MASIPRLGALDSSVALLADPYGFIGARCRELGCDAFETRVLLRPTICMRGEAAARVFYDPELFERAGAAPEPLRATLFGKGTVQSLDGAAHQRRKALFLELTGPEAVGALLARTEHEWRLAVPVDPGIGPLSLYDLARRVLCRAVCDWAGVPLPAGEAALRTRQLSLLFDGAAGGPVRHLRSRVARIRAEAWLGGLVQEIREGRRELPAASAAYAVAMHRDADGERLPPRVAAAELLNLLRPTVAVAVFIVFAAHALHTHTGWRTRLRANDDARERDAFVQEVRRYYPFFPSVIARVRRDFEWNGLQFPRGRRVILDLFGTNHDPRCWESPRRFRPERFLEREPGRFDFIPQGGGEAEQGHRCPGEGIAGALTGQAVALLLSRLEATVAPQDLTIDMKRLPALPHDRFMVKRLRWCV